VHLEHRVDDVGDDDALDLPDLLEDRLELRLAVEENRDVAGVVFEPVPDELDVPEGPAALPTRWPPCRSAPACRGSSCGRFLRACRFPFLSAWRKYSIAFLFVNKRAGSTITPMIVDCAACSAQNFISRSASPRGTHPQGAGSAVATWDRRRAGEDPAKPPGATRNQTSHGWAEKGRGHEPWVDPGRVGRVGTAPARCCRGSSFTGNTRPRRRRDRPGLMNRDIGGYLPGDIEVVAAFDIDRRKVGRPVAEAIFALPNCTKRSSGGCRRRAIVRMGPSWTAWPPTWPIPRRPDVPPSSDPPCDVGKSFGFRRGDPGQLPARRLGGGDPFLRRGVPRHGVSLVNCIPVFIASDPEWADRFRRAGIPLVGDDIKSQLGATIVHRALARLFSDRGSTSGGRTS